MVFAWLRSTGCVLVKRWKKVCWETDWFLPIATTPPHHQHDLDPRPFVCLPMSRGSELPETLRAQIVILKQRVDSWAWICAFLGVTLKMLRKPTRDGKKQDQALWFSEILWWSCVPKPTRKDPEWPVKWDANANCVPCVPKFLWWRSSFRGLNDGRYNRGFPRYNFVTPRGFLFFMLKMVTRPHVITQESPGIPGWHTG